MAHVTLFPVLAGTATPTPSDSLSSELSRGCQLEGVGSPKRSAPHGSLGDLSPAPAPLFINGEERGAPPQEALCGARHRASLSIVEAKMTLIRLQTNKH